MTAAQYVVIDRYTQSQVGRPYHSRGRATARVDRLDAEYGAYRYDVRLVETRADGVLFWSGFDPVTKATISIPVSR